MRVVYGAVDAGATAIWPSLVSGLVFANAVAVPPMKYSACSYPTSARSKLVPATNGPLPVVMGPVMVGLGTARAVCGTATRASTATARRTTGGACRMALRGRQHLVPSSGIRLRLLAARALHYSPR